MDANESSIFCSVAGVNPATRSKVHGVASWKLKWQSEGQAARLNLELYNSTAITSNTVGGVCGMSKKRGCVSTFLLQK